jgi:hypothetical protein
MTRIAPTGNEVFTRFIAAANQQYRDAGLGQYQMHVRSNGTVDVPHSRAGFKAPSSSGSAAGEQAKAGAAQPAPSAGAAPAPAANVKRSGPAPQVVDLKQGGVDAFKIAWKPIAGAKQYGVWQDGALIGHVTDPSFAANLAPGASGIIQIDAVLANGTRSALTRALRVTRTPDNKITFDVPGATGPATAQPPTAPAGSAG